MKDVDVAVLQMSTSIKLTYLQHVRMHGMRSGAETSMSESRLVRRDPDESICLEKCCLNKAFPDAPTISPPTPSAVIFTTLIPYGVYSRVQMLSAVGGIANPGATLRLGLYETVTNFKYA